MAIELHIFLRDSLVPSRDAWQQSIEASGFSTVLQKSLDLRRDTGFRPANYKGQATGFEFCLEPAADILSSYKHIARQVGDRDMCATLRFGGNLLECAAAISSAAALTQLADGIYFYPDDDLIYTAKEVVEATRGELNSM